tara:strand:- start:550 stop:810 length:261 start_codon:yes stop_codon:yes gene_type:complete
MTIMQKDNVDKRLEGGGRETKVADLNEHIDLEIMNLLSEAFEEAKKNGFKGSQKEYMDSLSLDDLKRIGVKTGGLIKPYREASRRP